VGDCIASPNIGDDGGIALWASVAECLQDQLGAIVVLADDEAVDDRVLALPEEVGGMIRKVAEGATCLTPGVVEAAVPGLQDGFAGVRGKALGFGV